MATMTPTPAIEAIKERLTPALDTIEQNTRKARRAIVRSRNATEDFVAETVLGVRRHPLMSVAAAAGAGVLAGCLVGFMLGRGGRPARRRVETDDVDAWDY